MMQVLQSNNRGYADHGWLKSRHTFSFADYHNPEFMGYRTLRVINEDRIEGGTGFGRHPHSDMEIISYVISGALEHKDSMGNNVVILPGEVQRMSAGSGVAHSEYNQSPDKEAHFFQIWIRPKARGGQPGYGQKSFEKDLNEKKSVLVISEDGRDGSISIKQDADLYISRLKENDSFDFNLRSGRGAWIQVVKGSIDVNGKKLNTGDALAVDDANLLQFKSSEQSEFLLFDLA